jgi:uncharacterized protein (DUF1330 family)
MKKLSLITVLVVCGLGLRAQIGLADSTRPVVHTVLFQFKAEASAAQVAGLMKSIGQLNKTIPGILQVSSGENFSERSKGYTHAVVMIFDNAAALKTFYVHPEHQRLIREQIKPILADMIVVDYEKQ